MRATRRAAAVAAWGALIASAARARTHQPEVATAPAAYLVIDADGGTVLAEHDAHRRWPPASMTKMMTVLLAMERVQDRTLSLDEPVRTSAWASRIGGSQVYLAAGATFPLGELLKAIMIASANAAAVAVAEHIAGSSAAFVDLMNARAEAFAGDRLVAAARSAAGVSEVPVAGGTDDRVKALATSVLVVLVKRAKDRGVVVEARVPPLLQAPVRRSQPLCDVVIRRGDQEL